MNSEDFWDEVRLVACIGMLLLLIWACNRLFP